jgi:hypothetical protein
MEEIKKEIKRVESIYDKLEKTENGSNKDWYYSGILKGLRQALIIINNLK